MIHNSYIIILHLISFLFFLAILNYQPSSIISNISSSGKYLNESLPASFSFCSWHKEATESPRITTLHGPWICPRPDGNWHHLTLTPGPRAVNPSSIYLRWQAKWTEPCSRPMTLQSGMSNFFPLWAITGKICNGITFVLFLSVFDQKLWKLLVEVWATSSY